MKNHMFSKHPEMVTITEEQQPFVFSQAKFREALLQWIHVDDQPFAEVGKRHFIAMINTLNPEAIVISDKTVRADSVKKFNKMQGDLKEELSFVPGKMSITMDGWTSGNVHPFLAIRGHWLDKDWGYHSKLLDFAHIQGEHSGLNLKKIFCDCLTRLGIPFEKILGITVDNATNNDTFFFWLYNHGIFSETNQIRCLAHILNLVVQDMLAVLRAPEAYDLNQEERDILENEDLPDIDMDAAITDDHYEPDKYEGEIIIVKLRELVKKIRRSCQMRQKLKKCCELHKIKYLVPIIDVRHRWNSTFDMVTRAEYLKLPLGILCSKEQSLSSLSINYNEWFELNEIQVVLSKFKRATLHLSMERHPTITAYLPIFHWLTSVLEDCAAGHPVLDVAAREGLLKLEKYKPEVNKTILPFLATVLHPALKLNFFKEHNYSKESIKEIKSKVCDYFAENYETSDESSHVIEADESDDEMFLFIFKRTKKNQRKSEIEKYLQLPLADKKVNVVDYWKAQKTELPLMSKMAMDVFPVQSASVAVERDFSKGSRVVTPNRASLKSDTINMSMCLKSWIEMDI